MKSGERRSPDRASCSDQRPTNVRVLAEREQTSEFGETRTMNEGTTSFKFPCAEAERIRRVLSLFLGALTILVSIPLFAAVPNRSLVRHSILGAGAVDAAGGVKITAIVPGQPASHSDLKVGDIVTSIAGDDISSVGQFIQIVRGMRAATPIAFAIVRSGVHQTIKVTLARAPDEHDPAVLTRYETLSVDGSLRRTLITLPPGAARSRPAMLLVGGIGCYSIDNAEDQEDSYMRLSHDVSRAGFLVMRLEKSGVGDSQGPPCPTVDLETETRSYQVALEALRHDPRVDPARIYIFGHSIGSLIAPRLASNGPVAGLVVAEAVGRNWVEYELLNLRRQLELDHVDPATTDDSMRLKELCMHRLLINREAEADIERTEPGCKEHDSYPAPAAYLQQAAAINIAAGWAKLSVPVLVIYGSADFITAEDDHRRIVDIVNARRSGAADLKIIEGMDHRLHAGGSAQADFDRAKRGADNGRYEVELSATVRQWLCAREICSG